MKIQSQRNSDRRKPLDRRFSLRRLCIRRTDIRRLFQIPFEVEQRFVLGRRLAMRRLAIRRDEVRRSGINRRLNPEMAPA